MCLTWAACLVLHSMCIIMHRDSFLTDWVLEAEEDLQTCCDELETQMQASCTLIEVWAIVVENPNDMLERGQSGGDGALDNGSSSSCHGTFLEVEQ